MGYINDQIDYAIEKHDLNYCSFTAGQAVYHLVCFDNYSLSMLGLAGLRDQFEELTDSYDCKHVNISDRAIVEVMDIAYLDDAIREVLEEEEAEEEKSLTV